MPTQISSSLSEVQRRETLSAAPPVARKIVAFELLMAVIVLVWGVNYAVVKAALRQFLPLAFNALRFLMAALALLCAAYWRGVDMRLTWREVRLYSALGFVVATLYQVLFIEGIARTTAGNSALIIASSPVLIALAGHFMGRERLRVRTTLGVLLAFAGLYFVIMGKPHQANATTATLVGDLLTLAAACTWAFYTIISQPFLKGRSALKVTAYSIAFGTVPLVLWCIPSLLAQSWKRIDFVGWSGLLFSGLLSIAFAQLIWNYCLARIGPARTSIFSNLVPIVALLTGAIFLREKITSLQAIGAFTTLSGIALARWRRE